MNEQQALRAAIGIACYEAGYRPGHAVISGGPSMLRQALVGLALAAFVIAVTLPWPTVCKML